MRAQSEPMTTSIRGTCTPALTALVADLDRVVPGHGSAADTARAVAAVLAPYLGDDALLTPAQRRGDPRAYCQHLLYVAEGGAYSLVALVWQPGQATPVHDHVCWCVVGVHRGQEDETRFRLDEGRLVTTERLVNAPGQVSVALPPGDIHLVRNAGKSPAVSLHVYGADLAVAGTSIRRTYDVPTP
jgi:predicted metal-dependent enzyme (double-stranded beta helix superfamily)